MNRIPEWCSNYISIPYEEKNCWQLMQSVYAAEYGIHVGSVDEQPKNMKHREWVDVIEEGLGIREGDVILFASSATKKHVGVILNHELMLHTTEGANACIERWKSHAWEHKIVSVYRWATECPN